MLRPEFPTLCQTLVMHSTQELVPLAAVTTTVASQAHARTLACAVLQQRLAACVQVEPITAHYRWEGVLHEDVEWRLVCKTMPAVVPALLTLLQSQHPYSVPQLVVQPLQSSRTYAEWVAQELAQQN